MVLLEAMACNVPYVCADIDSLRETTKNGQGGLLYEAQYPEDMARKIIELINKPQLYQKKQKEGSLLVKKYKWEDIVPQLESIYMRGGE